MLDKKNENLSQEESTDDIDNIKKQSEEKQLPKSNIEKKDKPVEENSMEGEFLKVDDNHEVENEENLSDTEGSES